MNSLNKINSKTGILTAVTSAMLLAGCEIDMVYLDDGYYGHDPEPASQLSIRESDATRFSRVLFDLEALSLLPADIAGAPGYFISDGGSDLAISPLLTLLNRVGDQFFLSSDWEDLTCAEVTRSHRDESELFGHELQGQFIAKWNGSDCFSSDYLGLNPEWKANLDSYVTWTEDLHHDDMFDFSGLTKLDWRFDNAWGGILLEQSLIRTSMDSWGWINADIDINMNIDSGWQKGILSIETVEPLSFAPGSTIADSGWLQIRTRNDVLDIRVLSDSIRVILNGRWLTDY